MNIKSEEIVSIREFRRESAGLLERLAKKKLNKLVLTRHGEPVAVLVTPATYERMET